MLTVPNVSIDWIKSANSKCFEIHVMDARSVGMDAYSIVQKGDHIKLTHPTLSGQSIKLRVDAQQESTTKSKINTIICKDMRNKIGKLSSSNSATLTGWTMHRNEIRPSGQVLNVNFKKKLKQEGLTELDISALAFFLSDKRMKLQLSPAIISSIDRLRHVRNEHICHLLGGRITDKLYDRFCEAFKQFFQHCIEKDLLNDYHLSNFEADLYALADCPVQNYVPPIYVSDKICEKLEKPKMKLSHSLKNN